MKNYSSKLKNFPPLVFFLPSLTSALTARLTELWVLAKSYQYDTIKMFK